MVALFWIASARKHFSRRTDAVGDQLFMRSFICISPLIHILAFSLSSPPYEFNLALKAHFTGITSSAGRALSLVSNASLSNSPKISFLIDTPHFSFTRGDNFKTWDKDLGYRMKSDKLIRVS